MAKSQDLEPETTHQLLLQTEAAQARASSPGTCAWVSANAGAGKTHVLKLRVLKLLLTGTPPERILCLTYTKAAAAEMSQRVFSDLAEWAIAQEAELMQRLSKLLGRAPTGDEISLGRQLFARAIETPGGLKVQTIHAFCERLLQRFPLEAEVPPGFAILDDELAVLLRREAINATLGEANAAPTCALGQALQTVVMHAADERFNQVLDAALQRRQWIEDMQSLMTYQNDSASFAKADRYYRGIFKVAEDATKDELRQRQANVLSPSQLLVAADVLHASCKKRDQNLAHRLTDAARATRDTERISALSKVFLTQARKPRSDSQFITKGIRTAEPGITDQLINARDCFYSLSQELNRLMVVEATLALLRLSIRIFEHYQDAKVQRTALDFEDLIHKTARLLASSEAVDWVLYKLDGGIDHILVDEAQDTSPSQWNIIEAMAAEFFAGEGASDAVRSVFAVGDEKQSIYSFQGAAPEQFARAGRNFAGQVRTAGRDWANIPLTLSFRTVKPLLDAVDAVFANEGRTPGVNVSGSQLCHEALRIGQAGCFEIWPTIKPEAHHPAPSFAPLDDVMARVPSAILAAQIADQIKSWLDSGEILQSQGRAIRAGDFLIMVRRRQPFAPQIVRALKSRKIPVAGADRIVLSEQLVIQDLLALADFLLLPEDDLALANVLKSPLFNIDDDDLLLFAPCRRGALWSALLAYVKNDGCHNKRLCNAVHMLKRWRAFADFAPPYEFFATLLEQDGGRARLIGRLGPDAADPLDEFMNLALSYDEQAPASLQGFIGWLRDGVRHIKRDMDQTRDEVRVMTVHGAKGLEAPIVFLPDTCAAPGGGSQSPLVDLVGVEVPAKKSTPQAWAIKGTSTLSPIADGRAVAVQRELEEHNRLLYVALTRARDCIYIAGFEGHSGRQKNCWYDTILQGLEGQLSEFDREDGEKVWRIETPQTSAINRQSDREKSIKSSVTLPIWARSKAPSEPQLTIPLAPSRLAPLGDDKDGELVYFEDVRQQVRQPEEPAFHSPRSTDIDQRFLQGTLTHSLFEHLPNYPEANRLSVAKRYMDIQGKNLSASVRALIIEEVMKVISDPTCSAAFGSRSRAEVPIVADLISPLPDSPPLRLSGQIDRLVQTNDGILIIDFKTHRQPPQKIGDVPVIYLLQLAAYRLALQNIFPDQTVRSALLWTAVPILMEMPADMLDTHQQRLWSLAKLKLDAR